MQISIGSTLALILKQTNEMKKHNITILFLLCCISLGAQTSNKSLPFNNPSLSTEKRVDDLVSRLSVDEKISQMQHAAVAIPRLGIPSYNWWNECLHGVARNGIATVFPQAIGLAATWNTGLVYEEADVISTEGRAKYYEAISKGKHGIYQGLNFWSPNINIFRDPRWGRGQETYGEDPYLTAQIGTAFVKGLQGNDPKHFKTIATAKHFAVHSGPEPDRHKFDAWVSEKDLYETYLPAFEALVKDAKVYSIMGAYNRVYGTPACASDLLLDKILRKEWGFTGFVVSDCWAVTDFHNGHNFVPDAAKASTLAVKAGTDLSCGGEYGKLKEALEKGYITEAEIDVAVKRLFTARFKLGLFDPPAMVSYSSIKTTDNDTESHKQLALKVAQQSIVLLKNNNILPLSKKLKIVTIVGPNANDTSVLYGNYNGIPSHTTTALEALRMKLGAATKIIYERGITHTKLLDEKNSIQHIIQKVAGADVIIFVGGISAQLEGEEGDAGNEPTEGFKGGDRTTLSLPTIQTTLMQALKATGKPLVVVNMSGSAMALNWENANADAIVQAWYGGQSGGTAIMDVLFGDYNPAGRLPVTFYQSETDLPAFDDYNMKGRTYRYFSGKPLYEFGYGLSFSKFNYSNLNASKATVSATDTVKLKITVKNIGKYAGDEVVQVYFKQPVTVTDQAIKTLVAFNRVPFKKGENKELTFYIPVSRLRHFDSKTGKYSTKKGIYEFMVGASSEDIRQRTAIEIN